MMMTPKDELGCSKEHYGADKDLFCLLCLLIVSDAHDPHLSPNPCINAST
jgi:hypothetical protein